MTMITGSNIFTIYSLSGDSISYVYIDK